MLQVNTITFSYSNATVLDAINFEVKKGEHVAIIGESGCGKSTLLKAIYGTLQLNKGAIFWDKTQILGPDYNLVPGETFMKYLSQDFDLMPFITVEENISQFLSPFNPVELKERTQELLKMIEMEAFAKTKVKNLSGGQQQRVALARVLAQEPEILLLDEPFSHIDNFRKNSLRRNIFGYLKKKNVSCLVATHDPDDILSFADQALVLKDGKMVDLNNPKILLDSPKNKYIASLFFEVSLVPIPLLKQYAEIDKSILIYPHEFKISDKSGLKVKIQNIYFKGTHYCNEAKVNDKELIVFFNSTHELELDAEIYINVSLETINKRL